MTKSVTPADQFSRMRDVINGRNPVLFVSDRVRAIADSVERSVLRPGDVLWVMPFVGG